MKKALYVGLTAPKRDDKEVLHVPLITIVPRKHANLSGFYEATHVIVTSKTAATLCKELFDGSTKTFLSVGSKTTAALTAQNILTAVNECQEGIIELIESLNLSNPLFFWPHASGSRPLLASYLTKKGYRFIEEILYDTHFCSPKEPLNFHEIDEIHFTSPSTVEAFFHLFGPPPEGIQLIPIGEVTKASLEQNLSSC